MDALAKFGAALAQAWQDARTRVHRVGFQEDGMGEDTVVLWRDSVGDRNLCYEIVQIGESEFELRVLCDGQVWLEEDSSDLHELIERAHGLHVDVHPSH